MQFATPLAETLMKGLPQKETQMLCMEVMKDVLERYGADVAKLHPQLLGSLTDLLRSETEAVRKRASVTLGPLVGLLDEKEFNSLMMKIIIKNLEGPTPDVYIQCVGVTCKAAGTRVGEFLPEIVPKLARFCEQEAANQQVRTPTDKMQ